MGRKLQIAIAIVVLALIAGAVGAYAWDASKKDEIADGVRIGKVDVGGMSTEEARRAVRHQLLKPLDRPVTVKNDGTRYVLNPDQVNVRGNVDAMADAALEASREGSLPSRVWREVSGDEVNATITPSITYSRDALDEFIAKVAEDVDTPAQDASIEASGASLNPVPSSTGTSLREQELRRQLEAAVLSPRQRTIAAQVEKVQPDVTTEDLAQEYPTYLTVDRASFQLRLWKNLELVETYPIAVGAVGFDTPAGLYHIQNKAVDPAWSVPNAPWTGGLAGEVIPGGSPENPLKARWLGIFDGAGIHGTDDVGSLGSAASHGCIRMAVPDVIALYDQVPVGAPIYIG